MQKSALALIFCISSMGAAALPIPIVGDDAKVAVCVTRTDQGPSIFNPTREYGTPIRYARLGEPFYLIVGGTGFSFDLDGAIEEAMAEWSAAVPSLKFQSVTKDLETSKTWKVRISDENVERLGSGYRIGTQSSTSNPELVFYVKGFWKAAVRFNLNIMYMESDQLTHYLAFLLRLVVKHEVGHLLGFLHPTFAGEDVERDATGCPMRVIFTPDIAAGPPIMGRAIDVTLRQMAAFYDRRLRLTDIQIAPQEAAVARAVYEATCPVDIGTRGNTPSNRSLSCPHAYRVISPAIPAINLLLKD